MKIISWAKLGKKSYILFFCALYFCFSAFEMQAQCDWQQVGNHRQTSLREWARRDLAKSGTHFFVLQSALVERRGNFYLQIYIEINDTTAQQTLGDISPEAELDFLPISKKSKITLLSPTGAKNALNAAGDALTYNCIYRLKKRDIRRLQKTEVDAVVLYWSGGRREFPIYDVDFFRRLTTCNQ
jgi:hypothetical protein